MHEEPLTSGRSHTVYFGFTGVIDPANAKAIAAALNTATNDGCSEVYLCMNSPGGYVGDGIYLYNHIRALPIPVTIHNTGNIASIAAVVFVAGEKRYCSEHASFMTHPTVIGPTTEPLMSARLDSSLKAALADDQRTESILRSRTQLPARLLRERRSRDVLIHAEDALKFGFVQGVREFLLPKGQKVFQI